MVDFTLFCLPFAGGSKYVYSDFREFLSENIVFSPIELPGRGSKTNSDLLTNVADIVEDVFNQVRFNLEKPYFVYGHSMGALLGYLLAIKLREEGLALPTALILSGREAPFNSKDGLKRHKLPRKELFEKIESFGGVPKQVLEDEGLKDFFEPILRADFEAVDSYRHIKKEKLSVPITVMIGANDKVSFQDAKDWEAITKEEFNIHVFPGDHFFIFKSCQEIVELINKTVEYYGRKVIVP